MKKIINITLWSILSAGLLVLLGFAVSDQRKTVCKNVIIQMEDGKASGFVSESDIFQIIAEKYDSLTGQYLDSINTMQIRETLMENPYVAHAEVTKTILGTIKVKIERHEPLVRVINLREEQFYISSNGTILPPRKNYIPRIIIATGYINTSFSNAFKADLSLPLQHFDIPGELASVSYLASKLCEHPNLKNTIQQIYFTKQGEIELVPASGNYIVILGNVFDLDIKLRNYIAMYHAGYLDEPVSFRSINLKYTNQVVCKK
jgi:cell division protein FtsQ